MWGEEEPTSVSPTLGGRGPETIRLALEAANIEARPVWKPIRLQPVFRECEVGGAVTESLFEHGLCLPSGANLSQAEVVRVAGVVRSLWR